MIFKLDYDSDYGEMRLIVEIIIKIAIGATDAIYFIYDAYFKAVI